MILDSTETVMHQTIMTQSHKIGSKFNRYSNIKFNYRFGNLDPLFSNNNSYYTRKDFEKYSIPEIKREFYRLNYSDASQNIFNNSFTNNTLNSDVKEFIKNELKNETNVMLKNDKRNLFVKTLLKNNNKNNFLLETSDLELTNIVSKNIEIRTTNTIDLINRDAENGLFFDLIIMIILS